VWTLHNLRPHEPRYPWLERFFARALLRISDVVVVHSESARRRALDELGPTKTPLVVMPHGHYIGVYPDVQLTRAEARARLALADDAFVCLAFGHVRRYKRLPELVETVATVQAPDVRLIVAGHAADDELAHRLRELAVADPRIQLELAMIEDEDVALYHRAADVAVLNYREVFSSGALLLALSFGLPVVAPAGGAADDFAASGATVLFGDDELPAALRAVRDGALEERGRAARAAAEAATWGRAAAAVRSAYAIAADARRAGRWRRARRR